MRRGRTALPARRWLAATVALAGPVAAFALLPARAAAPRPDPAAGSFDVVSVAGARQRVGLAPPAGTLPSNGWEGFGINWTGVPYARSNGGIVSGSHGLGNPYLWDVLPWRADQGQLAVDEQRLLQLHPAYVRMSWAVNWFDPTYRPGQYRWGTVAMQDLVTDLTFLQRHGIPVVSSVWDPPVSVPYGSNAWTQMEADLVAHLVDSWGFTNIKYFIGVNEPNARLCTHPVRCEINFFDWQRATASLYQGFKARGLLSKVQIIGPTVSSAPPWSGWASARRSVANWPKALADSPTIDQLGAVDWHQYIWTNSQGLPPTGLSALATVERLPVTRMTERIVRTIRGRSHPNKKTFISEFGFGSIDKSLNGGVPSFDYALAMLNFGIDLARSGVSSAAVWELDPDIVRFRIASDGLWRSDPPYAAYPLYEAVSMLTRAAPPGSVVEPARSSSGKINVLAARTPGPKGGGWSILVVNNSALDRWVQVEGLASSSTFAQFDLSRTFHATSWATPLQPDFYVPSRQGKATTHIGPHSAVLLTNGVPAGAQLARTLCGATRRPGWVSSGSEPCGGADLRSCQGAIPCGPARAGREGAAPRPHTEPQRQPGQGRRRTSERRRTTGRTQRREQGGGDRDRARRSAPLVFVMDMPHNRRPYDRFNLSYDRLARDLMTGRRLRLYPGTP